MKRKTFINRLVQVGGGMVLLPSVSLLKGCAYSPVIRTTLTDVDIPLFDEIGEIIIPSTGGAPGAKSVKIGEYIILIISDCYGPKDQEIFVNGLNTFDNLCAKQFKKSFLDLTLAQKQDLLEKIQADAISYKLEENSIEEPLFKFYEMLKSLTISGYFSSEIGMTQAREYLPVPGRYEGCIPYKNGDPLWAL